MKNALRDLVETKPTPVIIDGAMGTQLFDAGLPSGEAPEKWNLDNPDAIAAVHRSYIDAGSDIVVTNTFGGNAFRLKLHDLQDQVHDINAAGARIARDVADAIKGATGRTVLVAGSMGPTGELLEPMGSLTHDTAAAAFADQAAGLAAGGADVLWIETMSDLDEVVAAIAGAQQATDLPIVATLSFDTAGRTMMGVSGTDAANRLAGLGVTAIGANCGNNLADTEAAVAQIRAGAPDVFVVSKANAGIPVFHGDTLTYDGTPDVLGAHAHRVHNMGADIIGACCGSSPSHIAKIAAVLDGTDDVPDIEAPEATTTPNTAGGDGDDDGTAGGRRRGRRRRD